MKPAIRLGLLVVFCCYVSVLARSAAVELADAKLGKGVENREVTGESTSKTLSTAGRWTVTVSDAGGASLKELTFTVQ